MNPAFHFGAERRRRGAGVRMRLPPRGHEFEDCAKARNQLVMASFPGSRRIHGTSHAFVPSDDAREGDGV
jgi:hypothetical protein